LTFSCKTRGFCPSCHAKCLEAWGEWTRETLLLDVPHRQVVFTIPKSLRIFFKFRRKLLGELCRSAVKTLTVYFKALTGEELVPGIMVAVQTFGDRINFHPHLHLLLTEGGVDRAGIFHRLPRLDDARLAEIFGREVLALLVSKGLLSPEWAERILSWRHAGFNVHGGRGPGRCPGDPFPPHSPVDKDAGEWRAEGSPLTAGSGPGLRSKPSVSGNTWSGPSWRWTAFCYWNVRAKLATGMAKTARN
jgi:hypothetical protein